MSELLLTCPTCLTPNFTPRGLSAHRCKGKPVSEILTQAETSCLPSGDRQNPGEIEKSEVTAESPKDPRWDQVRDLAAQLRNVGRLFLRGQVRLGLLLSILKKENGSIGSGRRNKVPDSGKYFSWAELVKQETSYSRQSCDEFIRLYEAAKHKLKTSKTLTLPAPMRKEALALFHAVNPMALSDSQWEQVDAVIGTLTTGETQASLMQELGIVPKAKAMPKATKGNGPSEDEPTAGQLSFHFFEAMIAPVINARCNPDYKKLLYALPTLSTEDHPLSLATLESECRAMLADIEEVQRSNAKPAKGHVIH